MGGDYLHCFASEDESSTLDNDDYSEASSYSSSLYRSDCKMRYEGESVSGSSGFDYGGFDEVGQGIRPNSVDLDGNLRRRKIAYNEIMRNYDDLWARRDCLYQAKSKILSYTPGAWISNAGDKKQPKHVVPKTTTLLVIGPKGSGKSSLVNRISRVFEDDKFSSERAQVTYNSSAEDGTFFLQEYMVPRGSSAFCLFDTRSLSENFVDNDEMLQQWITKGVRHGQLVISNSDSSRLKLSLNCKAQQSGTPSSEIRKVNFVVFVVNGLSVLKAMNSCKKEDKKYMDMVTKTFGCPYLSYKDDKPVIVVTHGDQLSLGDRSRVRVYLGEKLGVPPAKQIFDIPDNSDPLTELMILDMIRYSLEHADKHLPRRNSREWVYKRMLSVDRIKDEVFGTSILTLILMAILLGIACVAYPAHPSIKRYNSLQESAMSWPSKSRMHYPPEPYEHDHLTMIPSKSGSNSGTSQFGNEGHHILKPQIRSTVLSSDSAVVDQRVKVVSRPTASAVTSQVMTEVQEEKNSGAGQMNLKPEVTSSPSSPSQRVTENQEQVKLETKATSMPSFSSKSSVPNSQPVQAAVPPPPPTKSVENLKHKTPSPSPEKREKRHPKSAVKWHKIRHLWLDE